MDQVCDTQVPSLRPMVALPRETLRPLYREIAANPNGRKCTKAWQGEQGRAQLSPVQVPSWAKQTNRSRETIRNGYPELDGCPLQPALWDQRCGRSTPPGPAPLSRPSQGASSNAIRSTESRGQPGRACHGCGTSKRRATDALGFPFGCSLKSLASLKPDLGKSIEKYTQS